MRITRISVYQLAFPLNRPLGLSGGRLRVQELDSTLVSIETDTGLRGWGEGCPWGSNYLPAYAAGIRAGIEELAPTLLGMNPCYLDHINRAMDTALPGHPYVKSALDMACWDILGKCARLPLYTLLGGHFGKDIRRMMSIFSGTAADMQATLAAAREAGYRNFSVKVGGDVEHDVDLIETMSRDIRPGEDFTFDANRGWLPHQAIMVMNSIDNPRLYFEQPCQTLEQCLTVRRQTRQPMILDECLHDLSDLMWAHHHRVAESISLKIDRVGGLTKARRLRDFCVDMGIQMDIEICSGTVFLDTLATHLAISTPESHRHTSWLCTDYHDVITGEGGFVRGHGTARPTGAPGLGVTPDMEVLGDPLAVYQR